MTLQIFAISKLERTQAHYSAAHGNPDATDDPLDWRQKRHYALTNMQWKYLLRTDAEDALYDMRNDRVETINLIGEHPESFPDTHGSPVMGMGYAAMAANVDERSFRSPGRNFY